MQTFESAHFSASGSAWFEEYFSIVEGSSEEQKKWSQRLEEDERRGSVRLRCACAGSNGWEVSYGQVLELWKGHRS